MVKVCQTQNINFPKTVKVSAPQARENFTTYPARGARDAGGSDGGGSASGAGGKACGGGVARERLKHVAVIRHGSRCVRESVGDGGLISRIWVRRVGL